MVVIGNLIFEKLDIKISMMCITTSYLYENNDFVGILKNLYKKILLFLTN